MNSVNLTGRLVREPELRYMPGGNNTAVTRFTVAVDRELSKDKKAEAEQKGQPTADFINVVTFGKLAENCNAFIGKGSQVGVTGRIQTGSYEAQDGTRRYTTDVIANRVDFLTPPNKNGQQQPQGEQQSVEDIPGFYVVNNENIPF